MPQRQSLFELSTNDPVELQALQFKSKLAAIACLVINERGYNQTEVAKVLETTQPRVSDLMNGKLGKFSLDFLFDSLFRLGYALEMDYDPAHLKKPLKMALKKGAAILQVKPLYTARAVAHTLIERAAEQGLSFTRVKIQKLLYAAHGETLARHDRPLIDEPFSAWKYGPLVESLHHELKVYSLDVVKPADNWVQTWGRVDAEDGEALKIIDDVIRQMGKLSAAALVEWSSVAEGPWHNLFNDDSKKTTIENADIQQHFRKYALVRG